MTNEDYKLLAKELGAVTERVYVVKYNLGSIIMNSPFSHHFFNKDDEEICYYIEDLKNLVPMNVLDKPRIWSDEFKNHPDYVLIKL